MGIQKTHKNALFSQKKPKNISERYLRHREPLKRKRGNDSGRIEQYKKQQKKKKKGGEWHYGIMYRLTKNDMKKQQKRKKREGG